MSGIDASAFVFGGFLPEHRHDRINYIQRLSNAECTLVFYSACHDLKKDLEDLHSVLGSRKVSISNDITKKFEATFRGVLGEIEIPRPKGEFVIVIEGKPILNELNKLTIEEHVAHYQATGVSRMEALKLVARDRNLPKSEIYNELLKKK